MSSGYALYPFQPGQVVIFRKVHPCGGTTWEILRAGADITARCSTCSRLVTMKRRAFEKAVRSIRPQGGET